MREDGKMCRDVAAAPPPTNEVGGCGHWLCMLPSLAALSAVIFLWSFVDLKWQPRVSAAFVPPVDLRNHRWLGEAVACPRSTGMPLYGVQYVPHVAGEPYPRPDSDPTSNYERVYNAMHKVDLPLIGSGLGANTVTLRPWPLDSNAQHERIPFFQLMAQNGLCQMVPTFHASKYFADMVKAAAVKPNAQSSSSLAMDFARFGASVATSQRYGPEVAAWTIDLSLDLGELLPQLSGDECAEPKDVSYTRYVNLVKALKRWVNEPQGGDADSMAPQLQEVPFLLPLDLSTIQKQLPEWEKSLKLFLHCMHEWHSELFVDPSEQHDAATRWFFSFSVPVDAGYHYEDTLGMVTDWLRNDPDMSVRAVVMYGTQALKPSPANVNQLVEDWGTAAQPPRQQSEIQAAFKVYINISREQRNLDGFIIDEWQDDWDRGTRGPWFLAKDTICKMEGACVLGGRFVQNSQECARYITPGWAYPEYFGMASISSQFLQHCSQPRFREALFTRENAAAGNHTRVGPFPQVCMPLGVNWKYLLIAGGVMLCVMLLQCSSAHCRSVCCRGKREQANTRVQRRTQEEAEPKFVGYVTVVPKEARLRANVKIQLQSRRVRSNEEVGWWLWMHLSTQMGILEKQIQAEVNAQHAVRARNAIRKGAASCTESRESTQTESTADETPMEPPGEGEDGFGEAVCTIHKRVLEGVVAWCDYLAQKSCLRASVSKAQLREVIEMVEENSARPLPTLFAEALLLRVMECLCEQVISCPERLAFLYFRILVDAEPQHRSTESSEAGLGRSIDEDSVYVIDMDVLHDGLEQMQQWSNPYKTAVINGKRTLGLNFDDINESGIQCRDRVGKTFQEPISIMVVMDFFLSYRTVVIVKIWTVLLAIYIYLGSSSNANLITSNNGSLLDPKWLRVNMILCATLVDATWWVGTELLLIMYTTWQRWPSLGYQAPGVPGLAWYLKHVLNLAFSGSAAALLWTYPWDTTPPPLALEKPWKCDQEFPDGDCLDSRMETTEQKLRTLGPALLYMLLRLIVFVLLHQQSVPALIKGTPWKSARQSHGQKSRWQRMFEECVWVAMLGTCVVLEVLIFLPAIRGMNLTSLCGLDLGRFNFMGVPSEPNICTRRGQLASFTCVNCVLSVLLAWMLTVLTCSIDMYFVFYFYSSVLGSLVGFARHLNDLKNVSVPINLKPREGTKPAGNEAVLFEKVFGPGWQEVWRMMVRGLQEEAYISPHQASGLVQAAGVPLDGAVTLTRPERKERPINLSQFPTLAGERLAFFFQSLEQLVDPRLSGVKMDFSSETDALTGEHFDAGSIPSLTMIIPAYNETVVQTAEYLRAGAKAEDATNQSPDGQPGVGDLVGAPLGDGVNTNLAFLISQFPDEWQFLTRYLHSLGRIGSADTLAFYKDFLADTLPADVEKEVRLWASNRTQTVAKTVIGSLQYGKALSSLPTIREYYRRFPEKREPEDHVEVILCHQTFGSSDGSPENDEAVQLLLQRHANEPLYLVFDLNPRSNPNTWALVESFLQCRGGYESGCFKYASVKCSWSTVQSNLRVLEVLPRKFPLRLGHKSGYYTQGKACNQLNGLRFAGGHILQALDCNMGVFIGEGFKVPYVLRNFMPLDRSDRVTPRCRYLGFREYIFTGREGTVGKCHAAAEWTFGTIYQRFLSTMGTRMHYGHPDFVDAFFARNRGGMSKSSPVVNLSEDIFAGYNVRMRNEACPHVDQLEFEKGREASFNAASNFFAKISGGSVAVVRSRDNHLLCEKIGIFGSFSFYFTSVAFYVSNLLIDMSIYTYVFLFVAFTLAGIDLARLNEMGSYFATEWFVSIGLVSLLPQIFEMILEHGAVHALKVVFGMLPGASFFFIFQNKSIASEVRNGCTTGLAKYFFTGRPMANQHLTWKDIFCAYWKSHLSPGFFLLLAYCTYQILGSQTSYGRLPMVLTAISGIAWIIAPVLFNPYPRWGLIEQDLRDFGNFISGRAGIEEWELLEVMKRGGEGKTRTLYELGLHEEISSWSEPQLFALVVFVLGRGFSCLLFLLTLPAEILNYMYIYFVVTAIQWVMFLAYFHTKMCNILMTSSPLLWLLVLLVGHSVIGTRVNSPSISARLTEYVISFIVYIFFIQFAKSAFFLSCRLLHSLRLRAFSAEENVADRRLQQAIRVGYIYFFAHQMHCLLAAAVLVTNLLVSVSLAVIDWVFCGAHTWWLLNSELARTKRDEKYLAKRPPFHEQDQWCLSRVAASGCGSSIAGGESDRQEDSPAGGNSARHLETL